MKHKVSTLEGALLDAAVALAEGADVLRREDGTHSIFWAVEPRRICWADYEPSVNWQHGGPIIDRDQIAIYWQQDGHPIPCWVAGFRLRIDRGFGGSALTAADEPMFEMDHSMAGPTALIAACRAKVASVYGDEVELPG